MKKYNIIIIGAGSAGYKSAEILADNGKTVLLIDKEQYVGGVCLNHGCIPTKSYIAVCETLENIHNSNKMGIDIEYRINLDFNKILNRKNKIVKLLTMGLKKTLEKKGIKILFGNASIIDNHNIKINDENYFGENIIIATGSVDKTLNDVKIENSFIFDSRGILQINYIPKNLCIIGAGVIGIEMAIVFANLGSNVTLIEYFDSVLPQIKDKFIQDEITKILKKNKIKILLSHNVQKIDSEKKEIIFSDTTSINADNVLLAIGRTPIIDESIKKVGIDINERGFIKTNDFNQTNIKNIYAIGDVIGEPMLAHKAYYDAKIASNHILGNNIKKNYLNIPYSVFSIPPISHCGLTENEALEKGLDFTIIENNYASNGRAATFDARMGKIKLLIDKNKKILGVTIIGKDSDILIHELLPIIENNLRFDFIENTVHIHPTLSEIIGDIEI